MQKILYYEKLIEIKRETNSELNLNEVNNWQLCRTCLTQTADDDVGLGSKCVMDYHAGRFLNIKEVLSNLDILEVPGQEDYLPLKVCRECLDKIKTLYYFTIQVGKAKNVLKLLAYKLKMDKSNYLPLIKSEEIPIKEEFLFINDEYPQSIEIAKNTNTPNEETSDVEFLFKSQNNVIECTKNSQQLCENSQIFIKEERELIIDDIHLNELYSDHENWHVGNVENDFKAEGDQANNIDDTKEMHISEKGDITYTILKPGLNKKLYDKLPKILDSKCPVCQEIFNTGSELVEHINLFHVTTKAFKCRNCSAVFPQISALYRHNKQNHKKLLSRKFKRLILIFFDSKCAICKKIFNTKLDLVEHAKQFHPKLKAFKCRDCTVMSSNIDYLCRHYKKTHQNVHKRIQKNRTRKKTQRCVVKPSEYFDNKCAVCHKIFYSKTDFIEHGKQFHPKVKAFKCRDCSMHFSYMKSLILHNRAIHKKNLIRKNHICEICSQSCYSNSDLRIHLRIHTGERPYACPLCDWTFTMKSSLTGHLKTHERKPKPLKKVLVCEYCSKILKTPSLLKEHIRVHTDERPYECAVCGKAFRNKKCLKDHHRRIHLKLTKIRGKYKHKDITTNLVDEKDKIVIENKCAVCNKVFKLQRDLMEHGKQLHPNVKVFKCTRCEDAFADRLSLSNHFNRHHRIWHKKHVCELCSKSFFSHFDLKSHIMVHTGERPYSCSLCDKSYTKKITLRWHQKKVHSFKESQKNDYNCGLCFKNFINSLIFKRHLRVHTGDSAYTCSLWEKAYDFVKHQKTLLEEESNVTIKDKLYKCDRCDKRFFSNGGLNKHSYKYHPPTPINVENHTTIKSIADKNEDIIKTEILSNEKNLLNQENEKETTNLKSFHDINKELKNDPIEDNSKAKKQTTYKCDKCKRVFKFATGLRNHKNCFEISKKHKKKVTNFLAANAGEDNLCLSKDNIHFNNQESTKVIETVKSVLLKDVKKENSLDIHEELKSDNAIEIVSNTSGFSQHQQEKYECDQCHRVFESPENLHDHIKSHATRRSIRHNFRTVIYKES